jgi:hypothetical protein
MEYQAPRGTCPDNPTQAIEDLTHTVLPLWGFYRHEGQIEGHENPFIITDIAGIGFTFHAASVAASRRKCITHSKVIELVAEMMSAFDPKAC